MSASAFPARPIAFALAATFISLAPQAAVSESATKDDDIVVTGIAPNPIVGGGAPLFSMGDLEKVLKQAKERLEYNDDAQEEILECRDFFAPPDEALRDKLRPYERGSKTAARLIAAAQEAQRATRETDDVRRRITLGEATQAALEVSELKRQAAVNKMVDAQVDDDKSKAALAITQQLQRDGVPHYMWDGQAADELKRLATQKIRKAAEADAVVVENVSVDLAEDRRGAFLKITGQMRNMRDRKVRIPNITFTAFDEQGSPLLAQVAHARGSITPGKVSPFAFQMRPAPQRSKAVEVSVGGVEAPHFMSPPPHCFIPATTQRLMQLPLLMTSDGRPMLTNEVPKTIGNRR